jgi:predicted SnoaL-like aldol condensation-catalyzing enzyme
MAINKIEKVTAFLGSVGLGEAELALSYIDQTNYVIHRHRGDDDADGLREFILQVQKEEHRLKVIRAFQDGPYVFTHSEGALLGGNIFFDVFRLDGGLIREHWVTAAKAAPPNASGHTQTDGPTAAGPEKNTKENKALVRKYYQTIHIAGDHSQIPEYFAGDYCVRHEPGVRDGVSAFKQDLEELVKNRTIDEIRLLLGEGEFVFILAKGTHQGNPCTYVDLYRVKDQKISERWGFPEQD